MEFKHFKLDEFYCKCERDHVHPPQQIDDRLVMMLDIARGQAEVPFVITSGYRCPGYNQEVGGALDSAHIKGLAADIAIENSRERFLILRSLIYVGFKRIGIAEDYIHVDISHTKRLKLCWDYRM